MTGYRQVLAVRGMASLLSVALVARTATTASGMALTMYVVLGLDMSYAAAGVAAAAMTAGLALGGPLLGRMLDRRGVRVVLLISVAVQVVCWLSVAVIPYPALLAAAFVSGLLMVPAPMVTRQAVAAMTSAGQRRPAFALEAIQGELSYMVGPPIVILCAAQLPAGVVAWGVGAAIVLGGVGIALLDPPLRGRDEAPPDPGERPRRRAWLRARMVAALAMAFGATIVLNGTDLSIVARLKEAGQVSLASVVVVVFGASSIVGGLLYGALPRPVPPWLLLGLLGLVTIPAGLAADWRWLCAAGCVAGLLAAPTLSALSDAVTRLAPASVRGEATGLQASAMGTGFALGVPVVGGVIDTFGAAGGFAAAGLAGLAAASTGWLLSRRSASRIRPVRDDSGLIGASDPR